MTVFSSRSTPKQVVMKDRRLGWLYYSLCSLIFVYIIVFQVIHECQYLQKEVPVGIVRSSLMYPLSDKSCGGDDDCPAGFQPASKLPYCAEWTGKQRLQSNFTRPCQYLDDDDVFEESDSSAFIATRVDTSHETRVCSKALARNGFNCKQLLQEDLNKSFFVADIESFTIMFAHFSTAFSGLVEMDASTAQGYLEVQNGDFCSYLKLGPAPCLMKPNKTSNGDAKRDVITFETLLLAGNIDMDTMAGKNYLRDKGFTITVDIEYTNYDPWTGLSKPKYLYKVNMFDSGSYKTEKVVYGSGDSAFNDMILIDRHGVKLRISQGGSVGRYSFYQLLLVLTTSLTLLAIVTFIVDKLAIYCLSNRSIYYAYKYEETFDFSDAKDMTFKDALDKYKKDTDSKYSGYTVLAP